MRQTLKKANCHIIADMYDMDEGWQMFIFVGWKEMEDYTLHSCAEAWITQEQYGKMSFMFGSDLEANHQTLNQFTEMAYYNFDDYKDSYLEDIDILETVHERLLLEQTKEALKKRRNEK